MCSLIRSRIILGIIFATGKSTQLLFQFCTGALFQNLIDQPLSSFPRKDVGFILFACKEEQFTFAISSTRRGTPLDVVRLRTVVKFSCHLQLLIILTEGIGA